MVWQLDEAGEHMVIFTQGLLEIELAEQSVPLTVISMVLSIEDAGVTVSCVEPEIEPN